MARTLSRSNSLFQKTLDKAVRKTVLGAFSKSELPNELRTLKGWTVGSNRNDYDSIDKTFTFGSFNEAWGFMNRTAMEAEKLQHHPHEMINKYNKVTVKLTTHEAEGVSQKDLSFASTLNNFADDVF
jgi:4a-hydroxytetrahydrobiopterin dehydratase